MRELPSNFQTYLFFSRLIYRCLITLFSTSVFDCNFETFCRCKFISCVLKLEYYWLIDSCSEYHKCCEDLLQINKDISIYQKQLRILALEIYKSIMQFNPEFVWHCFKTNPIPYNLRKDGRLLIPPAKSVNFGTNSVTFRGSLLWNNLPLRLKNSQTIDDFKFEVKNLGKIHCTCTVCR